MKELTIEQKANAYDEAFKRAKRLYEQGTITESLNYVFPELKESEDEKIRRELIDYINRLTANPNYIDKYNTWIAWLEKQGKAPISINVDKMVRDYANDKEHGNEEFGKPTNCMVRAYHQGLTDAISTLNLKKQGEQKATDKIELKFKVGDWITNGKLLVCKVTAFDGEYYHYMYDGLEQPLHVSNAHKWHLWTIQDAKDGDVLSFDNDTIVIFKDLYNATTFHSYCHIEDGVFDISKDDMPDWWEGKGFHPATKEQCDTLMKAMSNAGYTFDFKKKELKKIKTIKQFK